jgi:hypothetical protein
MQNLAASHALSYKVGVRSCVCVLWLCVCVCSGLFGPSGWVWFVGAGMTLFRMPELPPHINGRK